MFSVAPIHVAWRAASSSISSWNSDGSTSAPAPASSILLMPSRSPVRGEAEATKGFLSRKPM